MRLSSQQRGRGGAVRWRAGTVLALLALVGQLFVSLLPMPVLAGDGTPICALDGSGVPQPDGRQSGHLPDCPVCQAAQLLGSLAPPAPVVVPVVYRRVEGTAPPVVARALTHRTAARPQARAPPTEA